MAALIHFTAMGRMAGGEIAISLTTEAGRDTVLSTMVIEVITPQELFATAINRRIKTGPVVYNTLREDNAFSKPFNTAC